MFPVLNPPEASAVAVWVTESLFLKVTVAPAETVIGFTPNAAAPADAALLTMLTIVLPPGGGGVVGPVGVLLPLLHADANTPNETMHANLSDDKDIEPRNPNLAIGRA